MTNIFRIFKIKREERWLALFIALLLLFFNGLMVAHSYESFTQVSPNYYDVIIHHFRLSGFDPLTYSIINDWNADYNVYRHPLLAFYMYVPYLLNQGLTAMTGINCALFLATLIPLFCGFYSAIFLGRIFREIIGLSVWHGHLLTAFFFSFGYVLVSSIVADHFVISMLLLLMALYVSGRRMKSGRPLKAWQTVVYFLLTAGTSLNNGLKIYLSCLFVNGRSIFRPKHLLAIIVPAALLWGFARWEYKTYVWPREMARKEARAKKAEEQKMKAQKAGKKLVIKKKKNRHVMGQPFMKGEFMRWTDATTSRTDALVENIFGEAIQLHQDYFLQDALINRPVIVRYRYAANYAVEGIIVLLFLCGIWAARRSKFFWLAMSYFALDMALHLGLGFGLNEVYIMTCHYMFVVPIAIGFLLKATSGKARRAIAGLTAVLTAFLLLYNGVQLACYLTA